MAKRQQRGRTESLDAAEIETAHGSKANDFYESEFGERQMRAIDKKIASWMEKSKAGSWEWFEKERLDNKKRRQIFDAIIQRHKI
jgi:hypothetical protein